MFTWRVWKIRGVRSCLVLMQMGPKEYQVSLLWFLEGQELLCPSSPDGFLDRCLPYRLLLRRGAGWVDENLLAPNARAKKHALCSLGISPNLLSASWVGMGQMGVWPGWIPLLILSLACCLLPGLHPPPGHSGLPSGEGSERFKNVLGWTLDSERWKQWLCSHLGESCHSHRSFS